MNIVYFAIPIVIAVGLVSIFIMTRAAKKRAVERKAAPLLRVYEARLLAACSGDHAAVERLIKDEHKGKAGISRLDAARRAHIRLKKSQVGIWPSHHQYRK